MTVDQNKGLQRKCHIYKMKFQPKTPKMLPILKDLSTKKNYFKLEKT